MYEVISYQQRNRWEEVLNQLTKKDIFYEHSYNHLYQSLGDGDPHLFFYEDERGNKICYSFFKRKINLLSFLRDDVMEENFYDIITPTYGYGGPISDVEDKLVIKQFRQEFEEYCQKENVICEFIRFHPLLQNAKFMEDLMEVSYDRETIYIDLTKSEEDIFKSYHKNHKRNVNKGIKNQLEFKVFMKEEAFQRIEEFYQLYKETMDKLNASAHSYFSTDYLKNLLSSLYDKSMIGAVFFNNKIIGAALCMYEGGLLHYHLGCSKKEYLHLGGNVFLLHNIAIWGKQNGLNVFHLGGGHVGRDSLFQFKYRFNPYGTLDFYIGKKVHNPQKYKKLVDKWEEYYDQESQKNFFPIYRNKPKKTELVQG
ncbi:lipid II:glycine glycyltransferase FemX [Neobacillus sp. LXY-4]|uniref:lipid II:glycine glycyltransferase FemX n=1 Tax=Neobacillus sp. LXY-4 TaxID=3379826 RepID=UPI003EE1D461